MRKSDLLLRITLVTSIVFLFGVKSFAQDEKKESANEAENMEFFRGGIKIEKKGDDTTIVYIHNNPWMKKHKGKRFFDSKKFNGHWAGLDLGWNGFVTQNFDLDFPANERYLDLDLARSMTVNINPIEINFNLIRNHFGITSGLGFTLNNYFFKNSIMLVGDSSKLISYNIVEANGTAADMKINKLFVGWLTIPLLLEYQTRSGMHMNSFHVTAGVIGGVRLCSFTKQSYYNRNTTYFLEDGNNSMVGTLYVGEKKIKNRDQFYLNPFKLDVTARIGWSFLNLWGTYTVTEMFQENKGPEVFPYAVGITLTGM